MRQFHLQGLFMTLLAVLVASTLLTGCLDSGGGNSKRAAKSTSSADSTDNSASDTTTSPSTTVTRPSNAVFLQPGFCACENKKAAILGDCASVCASNAVAQPTIYVSTKLGAAIEANSDLGTLANWCGKPYGENLGQPKCVLRASYNGETTDIELVSLSTAGQVSARINQLDIDKTYLVALVETTSGASSDHIQVRRIDNTTVETSTGPLAIDFVHQYTCIQRSGTSVSGSNYYNAAFKQHFYYITRNMPPAVIAGNPWVYCHDIITFGDDDDISFPRLELRQAHIAVWSQTDTRMYDLRGATATAASDTKPDINNILAARFTAAGVSGPTDLFVKFSWFFYPSNATSTGTSGGGSTPTNNNSGLSTTVSSWNMLGYIMQPFVKTGTTTGFCPTSTEYNGTNTMFNILKEYVGVDTEGLYLGVKATESVTITATDGTSTTSNAPDDFILVRESLLKKIWFYFNSSAQAIAPTDATVGSNTVYFYWPPDTSAPFVKKSTQKRYTVTHPNSLSATSANTIPTTITPSDRRFACIPVTTN